MSIAADQTPLTRTLKDGAAELGLHLSERQLSRLLAYQALLAKWNKVYNLTALRDPAQMMTHHLLDSLAAVSAFAGARRVLDVGAGGGLPGIVLAIWAAEAEPQMHITLVDTVQKKTAFLTQVKAELQLSNVSVIHTRVEQLPVEQQYDVITSRAFAELNDFIDWSNHLLQEGGKYIALKGVMPQQEIDRLPPGWSVNKVQALHVPGLDAERHLIFLERKSR
ncbi:MULTISPECIES: 16S rRNA (guanine(527)-N(7))-methyltransferase RsmG [unclassified Herbaspirillum]|uniref:16S rRNA (guanine(527)-N(7))-methyltransferase RsmG n=1 Tax=unclassified Herbaspirillum TaxID=2624150 RepID=UPI00114D9AEB|nr:MULTISPECIES: 16S rRNA (guanine(527)-N(7))-methyltransferase RsmG [unclassified Herbaspirillum]MBB5393947.1 16S rRNA (guanine527-N7)-methyltransferase [Herbaspirillum sp. SJZ102]TQK00017.1 16S rRNA m(7)G-527 methyltransferase [Herbaspirillum sp. SJZ130]TQK04659.1 16S rRNA m(7)G-527 methyltransferase [Herbaspirillum sp. SJZ106]